MLSEVLSEQSTKAAKESTITKAIPNGRHRVCVDVVRKGSEGSCFLFAIGLFFVLGLTLDTLEEGDRM